MTVLGKKQNFTLIKETKSKMSADNMNELVNVGISISNDKKYFFISADSFDTSDIYYFKEEDLYKFDDIILPEQEINSYGEIIIIQPGYYNINNLVSYLNRFSFILNRFDL